VKKSGKPHSTDFPPHQIWKVHIYIGTEKLRHTFFRRAQFLGQMSLQKDVLTPPYTHKHVLPKRLLLISLGSACQLHARTQPCLSLTSQLHAHNS